jgi:bacillopeptidase F
MNSYESKSGTSMAAPHVSGAVLLLKEAFPNLSGAELLTALYFTAIDMGTPGEDNTFGMGLIDCLAAFEYLSHTNIPTNPFETIYDVEVLDILEPQSETFCSSTVNPSFVIINNGDSTLYTMNILVKLNGEELTSYTWEGTLLSGESITETIEGFTIDEDVTQKHELQVQVSLNNVYEKDVFNNSLLQRFSYHGFTNAPFIETFESNSLETNNWKIENIDADRTWEIEEAEGIEGSTLSAKMRMYNYSSIGQRDALVSPNINLEEGTDYNLYFSYAHQNRNVGSHEDSLIVEISTDCGVNFHRVFSKGGDNLETTDTLDLNFEPSYASHWRNETIVLSEYVPNANAVIVKFSSVNGKQNNLYLDNIFVSTAEEFSITTNLENQFSLSPNPATNTIKLSINNSDKEAKTINLIDLSGRVLETKIVLNEQVINWDLSSLEAGYYIINMESSKGISSHSFIKR